MAIIINTRNDQERSALLEFLENHNYDYQIDEAPATPEEPPITFLPPVSPISDTHAGRDREGPMKIF